MFFQLVPEAPPLPRQRLESLGPNGEARPAPGSLNHAVLSFHHDYARWNRRADELATEIATEIADLVAEHLGEAFRPSRVAFFPELPKIRSAKIVRRAIRATVSGEDPGDLSSLENPSALDAIRRLM